MAEEVDMVNQPPHYTAGSIECIDALKAALTPDEFRGFLKGQVIKYIWRCGLKGATLEDVQKAGWYRNRLEQEIVECMAQQA